MNLSDDLLLRYSRHILLPDVGVAGQARISDASVLIVGAGGLGCPVALYLGAAGVGRLRLADGDTVDLTNLQRQIAHRTSSLGKAKVTSAKEALSDINPEVQVTALKERADEARLAQLVATADVVLDCSDNFATRYALNRVCHAAGKPLVSGAATRFDGQVNVFDFRRDDSPCYHCLYPEHSEGDETRCAVMGVFAPLVGIVGSMQASEALKVLAGMETLCGRMLLLNALKMEVRTVKLAKDRLCPVCSA